MPERVFVVGVGMTPFVKPGSNPGGYPETAKEAGGRALADAGISFSDVEQAVVGYVYGDSTAGQRAVYQLGMSGIPVMNVNNNCSTGSSALWQAAQAVRGGLAGCVLALGFEQMERGSLSLKFPDRVSPLDRHYAAMDELCPAEDTPQFPRIFGNAGREHADRFGTTPEMFAAVAEKNHRHSAHNPYAQFRDVYTLDEILASPMIHDPLTKLQCSPTSDGAAAAIVAGERFVRERGLQGQAVEILAQEVVTDLADTFTKQSVITLVGADMSREAAARVYERTGVGPEDLDVVELHDCFSVNEILTYEALGLAPEGKGGELVISGATTYGGDVVVNPSGGLISKGHPLGATGLAQCAELSWQLRGLAGDRQVPEAAVALQHNIGLGGAAVVTMYRKLAS